MLDNACNDNVASCYSDVDSRLDAAVGCLAGILNRINWMQAKYPLRKGDKIMFKTSTCFVDHLWELFAPFLLGEPAQHIPSSVCCYRRMHIPHPHPHSCLSVSQASVAAETRHKPAASVVPCIVPDLNLCSAF